MCHNGNWLITSFLLWKMGKNKKYRTPESVWQYWHDYILQIAMLTVKETAN